MFTGIVTDVGIIASAKPLDQGVRLRVDTAYDPAGIAIGVYGLLTYLGTR